MTLSVLRRSPILALTQGDPAGVGPEILLKTMSAWSAAVVLTADEGPGWVPLLIAEQAALESLKPVLPQVPWEKLHYVDSPPSRQELQAETDRILVLDPVGKDRVVDWGSSGPADAAGALAAMDAGVELSEAGVADALVTAPVSKESIARHKQADFRGHTEYLASRCGSSEYGRDYLMTFLAEDLRVALLSTHVPLSEALRLVTVERVRAALACMHRHGFRRIGVAGLNPHAGEGGLLGSVEENVLRPAIAQAGRQGVDACGPESPDSLFARARQGEFDWVLALYHDQGLIAVKTAGFGFSTNWTVGLPFVRTSVDHGTAFSIAGRGIADAQPMERVIQRTLALIREVRVSAAGE